MPVSSVQCRGNVNKPLTRKQPTKNIPQECSMDDGCYRLPGVMSMAMGQSRGIVHFFKLINLLALWMLNIPNTHKANRTIRFKRTLNVIGNIILSFSHTTVREECSRSKVGGVGANVYGKCLSLKSRSFEKCFQRLGRFLLALSGPLRLMCVCVCVCGRHNFTLGMWAMRR